LEGALFQFIGGRLVGKPRLRAQYIIKNFLPKNLPRWVGENRKKRPERNLLGNQSLISLSPEDGINFKLLKIKDLYNRDGTSNFTSSYAGEAFRDSNRIRRTLSYAFRPALSLKQLAYDPKTEIVRYQTKKGKALEFKPKDFIATLTQHIPDRYQNMRRYAGFYAANVRLRIRRAQAEENKDALPDIRMAGPIRLHWAKLIAKIFGENPVQCPRCHQDMKLKGFLLKTNLMFKEIQVLSRAPPPKEFPRYRDLPDIIKMASYEPEEFGAISSGSLSAIQDSPEEFFDQSVNW